MSHMKLTGDQVRAIRWLVELGYSAAYMAWIHEVSAAQISLIVRGKSRTNVGGPIQPTVPRKKRTFVGPEKAKEIRRAHLDGETQRSIADRYGVTRSTISRICSLQSYPPTR